MFITNGQIKYLFKVFKSLLDVTQEARFNYFVSRNITKLSKRVDKILEKEKKIGKPTKTRNDFEKLRVELLKSLAQKDKKGNPIIKDNQYVLTDQSLKLLKEKATKLEGYDDVVKELQDQTNKLIDLSHKKTYISLAKLSKENLPKDLPAKTLLPIIDLIKD